MQQINPIKQFYKQLCLWSGHKKFGSLTKKYVKKKILLPKSIMYEYVLDYHLPENVATYHFWLMELDLSRVE